jgi:hypothetical protein
LRKSLLLDLSRLKDIKTEAFRCYTHIDVFGLGRYISFVGGRGKSISQFLPAVNSRVSLRWFL